MTTIYECEGHLFSDLESARQEQAGTYTQSSPIHEYETDKTAEEVDEEFDDLRKQGLSISGALAEVLGRGVKMA